MAKQPTKKPANKVQDKAIELYSGAVYVGRATTADYRLITLYYNEKENAGIIVINSEIKSWFPCDF